jgi:hypothetical protein
MGAAGFGAMGVAMAGCATGRGAGWGAAGAAGFGAAAIGFGAATAGFFAAAFFFGAARLAAGFFAAARFAGALRAAVFRAAGFFAAAFLRAGAFFLALVFFAPARAALARRVVLRALVFLVVERFFPLVLVAMVLLRLSTARRRPPTAGACMHESFFTGPSLPSRATSQLFFSLYDDRSRKLHCGGRMVRLVNRPGDSLLPPAKSLQNPRVRAPQTTDRGGSGP